MSWRLWARLADTGLPLAGGGELQAYYRGGPHVLPEEVFTALAGPPGWLAGCTSGALIGLRLRDGAVSLETYDQMPEAPPGAVQLLAAAAKAAAIAAVDDEEQDCLGAALDDVVLNALLHDPDVLATPLPPLGVLVAMTGLEVDRGYVALPGGDGHAPGRPSGLDLEQRRRLARVRGVLLMAGLRGADVVEPSALRQAGALLAADAGLLAAMSQGLGAEPAFEPAVAALAAAAVEPGERAAAAYLLAVLADIAGDVVTAEAHLAEALSAAPDCAPALLLGAAYAAERGDATFLGGTQPAVPMRVGAQVQALLRTARAAPTAQARAVALPAGTGFRLPVVPHRPAVRPGCDHRRTVR